MKNIILFGGAFDPIHNGHINMAKIASETLNADVFFIPAKISVWKNESIEPTHKLKMLELAIKECLNVEHFHISTHEIDSSSDINYSIDTVKYFLKEYGDSSKLYFLIGTDQVNSFHKWKNAKEISELVQLIYFSRPGLNLSQENIKEYKMVEIVGEVSDANSTDIRNLKSIDVPDSVLKYIIDNNLYFVNKVKSYLSEKRYVHSLSVAWLSYDIAKANNLKDSKKAFIAGLIHDIGKEMSMVEQNKIMKEHFKEYLSLPPIIYHQFIGAYLAERDFDIKDPVILDAIKYHTTANSNMSDVAIIVHCADKIEPTRGFNSKELINALKCSVINGFKEVLKSNIEYYEKRNIDYRNELQMACLNQYLK